MRPLSPRERRLVSIGVLVVLLAVVWLGLIAPVLGGFLSRAEERQTLQAQYARDARTLASIPIWKHEAQQQQRTEGQYAIIASTAELASRQLQDRIARSVGDVGGLVRSSVPAQTTAASEVGMHVDVELTNQQLNQLLKRLESEEPYVVVEYISVAADRAFETGKLAAMDVKLQVSAVSIRLERDDPAFLPLCATAALGLLLVVQMLIPDAPLTTGDARLPAVARLALPSVQVDYPALAAAPVFAPDRKPDTTNTAAADGTRELVLVGVGAAGDKSVASIRDVDGVTQRVITGGTIQGWRLVSTQKDRVTLEKNGLQRTIPLTPGKAVVMPAGAAPKKADSDQNDDSDNSQ